MQWFIQPWVWMAGALVLGILEVLAPGWVFLGFAIGAASLALLLWLGLGSYLTLFTALVAFSVLSLVAYLLLRQLLGVRRGQVKIWDRDVND